MARIIASVMALIATLTQFLSISGNADYEKKTGLKEAINALAEKDEIMQTRYVGAPSDEYWSEDDAFNLDDTVILTKEKDRDFVILNLTDVHFSDYDYRAFYAFEGTVTIKRLVAAVQPDLITVSGDNVCADSTIYSMKRFTDLMESFGVPWAPIYGNHDDEGNCDLNYLADIMLTSPHCLMKKGDPEMGVGNYVINIAETEDDGTQTIVESIIMMDSHHSQPNEKQQKWFRWAAEGVKEASGGKAEVSLFMHIPLPEYQYAYDAAWDGTKNAWRDGFGAYGSLHEKICCEHDANGEPLQRGFFDVVKEVGNTKYVFCGHDHMNDFSVEYDGVRLTYMLKLGYGSGFQIGFNGGTAIRVGGDGLTRITHKTVSYGPLLDIVDIDLK